jgi:hypothetical protein
MYLGRFRRGVMMETLFEFDLLRKVPQEELSQIFLQGASFRLPYLESRIEYAKSIIRRFEEKYSTNLIHLKTSGLPENAGFELHEDFIEWEYWNDIKNETQMAVDSIKVTLQSIKK